MANVTFSGSVSAQAVTGETVTVTVTKPDATTETLTATTLADRSYTVSKVYTVAGAYSARASGVADAIYSSWQSSIVGFSILVTTRTGTLNVTVV